MKEHIGAVCTLMVTSALNTGINFGTKFLQTRNFWIHQILLYIKDHYH